MQDGKINWSALARKYGVTFSNSNSELKNGGQVLKEYLRDKGIDVKRFDTVHTPRIRRKRKRCIGCEISIPITPSVKEVNVAIAQKIKDGVYEIGELFTPREFSKLTL